MTNLLMCTVLAAFLLTAAVPGTAGVQDDDVAGTSANSVTSTSTPSDEPIRVRIEDSSRPVWQEPWISSLVGVLVGAFLAAGFEHLRRREDRARAERTRKAEARLKRLELELADARTAARAVSRTTANLQALLGVAETVGTIPPQLAVVLAVTPDGIRDADLAARTEALAAQLAILAGATDVEPTARTAIVARAVEAARGIVGDLGAESAARSADLTSMETSGRRAAEADADRMRG